MLNLKPYLPRPLLAVLAVLGVLFAIDLFALDAYHQLEDAADELRARSAMLDSLQPLPGIVLQMQSGMRGYLLTGDEAFLKRYRAASESFPAAVAHALALVGDDPAQRRRLEETARLTEEWLAAYLSPLVVKRSASEGARSTMAAVLNTVREGKGEALADRIGGQIEEIHRAEAARLAGWVEHVQIATDPEFQPEFVAAMGLPHAVDAFPHLADILPAPSPAARPSRRRKGIGVGASRSA